MLLSPIVTRLQDLPTRLHSSLQNLTVGDDHTQYCLLAGRSGGQTLIGDTASGGSLTFQSTAHATRGFIKFGTIAAFDEANGRLGVGTQAPSALAHFVLDSSSQVTLVNNFTNFQAEVYIASATSPNFIGVKGRGSIASPSATLSGDGLIFIGGRGYPLTTVNAGAIRILAAENFSSGHNGTYITMETAAIGAGDTRTERLRISDVGSVIIGNGSSPAALATNATGGFLYIPSCAGTPTGAPVSYSPTCPLVYDTTNNKLYAYNPTGTPGWKSVTLA